MNARNQLNLFFGLGALTIAGLLGIASGSWTIFVIAAILAIAIGVAEKAIRPNAIRFRR